MSGKRAASVLFMVGLLAVGTVAQGEANHGKSQRPVTVARVNLVEHRGAIPPSVLLTPKQAGLFRISVYVMARSRDMGPFPDDFPAYMKVSFYHDTHGGPRRVLPDPFEGVPFVPGASQRDTIVVFNKARSPIMYDATLYNTTVNPAYDLFIVVEQL